VPVLRFNVARIEKLTGLPLGVVEELLFRLKCEVEEVEDKIEVEINPDRPDMYVGEGLARAVLGLAGKRLGWTPPHMEPPRIRLENRSPPQRPYIAAAVVRNVNVDEEYLEELIQFQEKLHDTLGRRRRKAAIGFHDLAKLPSTRLRYESLPLASVAFKPLGSERVMTAEEVLASTEQGAKYGNISMASGEHPFLLAGDEVIAMPPVINAEVTRVEPGTRDLFIDVTGTDEGTVLKVLNVIVGGLSERPGATVEKVLVIEPRGQRETPEYEPTRWTLEPDRVSGLLGVGLEAGDLARLLQMMGHNASPSEALVNVEAPPYRVDLISWVDFAEDAAIALGYENIGWEKPIVREPGRLLWETVVSRVLRDLAVGLGFTEVLQLTLTSPTLLDALGYSGRVEVLNPVQKEYSVLRPSMLPSLLTVLVNNQHKRKPIKVFEIGSVVEPGKPPRDRVSMGLAILDREVGYEDVQAAVYAILRILGVDFQVREAEAPALVKGRTAEVLVEGRRAGLIGEVDPAALEALGLEYPVAVAEIDVEVLAEWSSKTLGQNTPSR